MASEIELETMASEIHRLAYLLQGFNNERMIKLGLRLFCGKHFQGLIFSIFLRFFDSLE